MVMVDVHAMWMTRHQERTKKSKKKKKKRSMRAIELEWRRHQVTW